MSFPVNRPVDENPENDPENENFRKISG